MRSFVRRGIGLGALLAAALGLGACGDTDVGSLWGGGNRAPTVAAVADQAGAEGQTLTISVSASDPDGDALTLSAANLPGFCALTDNGNGTGVISCTPDFGDAGTYPNLTVQASDGAASETAAFTLTVNVGNRPPVLEVVGDQVVDEGQVLEIAVAASDADGDDLVLEAVNLPEFCVFTDNGDGTGLVACAPGFEDAGEYPGIAVEASDGTSTVSTTFVLTVNDVNRPPELEPIADQVVEEGQILEIPVNAVDPDGDTLTLAAANLPGFCTLTDNGDGTGAIACAPIVGDAGDYPDIAVEASDGTAAGSATFALAVTAANNPPTVAAIANQTRGEGEVFQIPVSASDPDGDTLTLSAPSLPLFCTLSDSGDGSGVIACAPDFTHAGNYEITVTAGDGAAEASTTFTLTVEERAPPVANAGPDQDVDEEALVVLDGSASADPDGTIASYAWVQTLGPAVGLTGDDTQSPSFEAPGVGAAGELLEFELTVTDGHGLEAADTILVRVADVTGIVWNERTSPVALWLKRVAWSGTRFVALSALAGTVATSADARTWEARATGAAFPLEDVVWSPELALFVAVGWPVGGNAPVLTSPDGLAWTLRDSGVTSILDAVTWSGSQFVAISQADAIRSADGLTWTSAPTGIADQLTGITWTGTHFVAVGGGNNPVIASSDDGVAWTDVTPPALTTRLWDVAWDGTTLVAVGSAGEIWTSTDASGADWVQTVSGLPATLLGVTWTGSRFLAVGDLGLIRESSDGQTWTALDPGTTEQLIDVLETPTRIVVVGGRAAPDISVILTSP